MSCCGNKRRTVARDGVARAGPSSPQDKRREPPAGDPSQPRPSAALLDYLARKAQRRR